MDAPPDGTPRSRLTDLPEAARAHAQARFALLRPHLDEGVPLTRIAQTHGIPLRTLHAWLGAYRHTGLARPAPCAPTAALIAFPWPSSSSFRG